MTRRWPRNAALSVAVFAAACGAGKECPQGDLPSSCPLDAAVPSYQNDVAPIFHAKCQDCHRPVQPRSPDLSSYASIYGDRITILSQIYSCRMPNQGSLTAEERATLLDWFACGAPDN